MKKLILVVGLYFLVKAGVDVFRVVEHFSLYAFNSAYAVGFTTGQFVAPLVFLVVGVLLIRHSWLVRSSSPKQVPAI